MRLIDADAIPYTMLYKENWMTRKGIEKQGAWKDDIDGMPTIEERKKGKWIERHHAYSDEEGVIEEWQSCQCSVCGRYDTRPYMYYFQEPHFCSWCGAEMRGENDEKED